MVQLVAMDSEAIAPLEHIQQAIYEIRGQRVMLDSDLAALYGVTTSRLNEQVKRNLARFPADFMFRLTAEEEGSLRSQIAISNDGRGGRRNPPLAFTQEGVAMLSSVLRSERAIAVNIEIMRAFVRLRRMIAFESELRQRLEAIETRTDVHDGHIATLYEAIRQLMLPPEESARQIGFRKV
jgi:hypothetical protein